MTVKNPVWAEKALLVTNEVCLTWSLFSTSTCHPSLQKTSCLVPWTGPTCSDGDVRRKKSLCTTIAAYNRVMVAKQEVSTTCACGGEAGTHTTALAPLLRSSCRWVLEGLNLHKAQRQSSKSPRVPLPWTQAPRTRRFTEWAKWFQEPGSFLLARPVCLLALCAHQMQRWAWGNHT